MKNLSMNEVKTVSGGILSEAYHITTSTFYFLSCLEKVLPRSTPPMTTVPSFAMGAATFGTGVVVGAGMSLAAVNVVSASQKAD